MILRLRRRQISSNRNHRRRNTELPFLAHLTWLWGHFITLDTLSTSKTFLCYFSIINTIFQPLSQDLCGHYPINNLQHPSGIRRKLILQLRKQRLKSSYWFKVTHVVKRQSYFAKPGQFHLIPKSNLLNSRQENSTCPHSTLLLSGTWSAWWTVVKALDPNYQTWF